MPQAVPAPQGGLSPALRAPLAPRTWLLIGPLGRECAGWDVAPEVLAEHLRAVHTDARLFQMDLPGCGRLWREPSPADVEGLASGLRARATAAGLAGPFGLVAHSWMACAATEWARQQPDEVGALVLINPAMRPFTQVLRSVRPGLWPAAMGQLLGRRLPLGREQRLWRTHTRLHEAPPSLMQRWRELRREHPPRARTALAQLLAVWRYEGSRRRPHKQVLLLAGKRDPWRDWRVAAAISRAWGAALRLHPEAGHDLLLDDPEWVARSVAEWLVPVGSRAIE